MTDREKFAAALSPIIEQVKASVDKLVLVEAGFRATPVDEEQVRADEREKVAAQLEGIRWDTGYGNLRRPNGYQSAASMVRTMS